MLTLPELTEILADNFTPEEMIEALEIETHDIVVKFSADIEERQDELLERVKEDLGYATHDED